MPTRWPGEETVLRWGKDLNDLHSEIYWRAMKQPRKRPKPQPKPEGISTLDDAVREHIWRALRATNGKVDSETGAVAILGVNPSTLRSKMRKLGIR